ncbi:muscular LMNA-interacting protein isoform X2 [Triplophysa rosa]|uniref:muscular LMNA-interacting protein isoform X2 n=1 Tax=Triplophysa rosa TaxID=992332 RepID=UPI0025462605|nr:muscular LMNA-interacting protein isoform X2 [Triplophysa rosa]
MAFEKPHGIFGKVTTVFATKVKSFSFVPHLKRMPFENKVTSNWQTSLQTNGANKCQTSREPGDSEESMTNKGVYKAEVIYIQDHDEEKIGETVKMTTQNEIQSADILAFNSLSTLAGPHVESGCTTPKPSPVTTETIYNKQPNLSHLDFHNISVGAEVSSCLFLKSPPQREEVLSPASSIDFLTSPASSKESIFSESWDKERSWSALHMLSPDGSPDPFSRTVSPCSSIRSGAFTPSVVRIKRHALAPGYSLLQMSPTCETPCCDSRGTSPCPLSPRARHRPPPTQLSLLTAILRKGRLPVLSSALQRPYTPCWPITSVSMTSCLACSAASTVSLMNMSKAKSCSSIDRPCRESCQDSEPQPLKQDQNALAISFLSNACDKGQLKTPERFDSCRHATSNSSIALPTKHSPLTLPNLPTVLAAPSYLSKTGHKDSSLSTAAGPPSHTSFSHIRSMSPKSNTLSCCNSDKNPSVSSDSVDPQSWASLVLNDRLKSQKLSEKDSLGLKQGQQSSDFSARGDIISSSDHLASLPKPPQSSYKSSSFPSPKSREPHDNSSSLFLSHITNKQDTPFQNGSKRDTERVHLSSPASPSPRPLGLTCLSYTPPVFPACPSVQPYLQFSTSERFTPSPAAPSSQLSPSYSLCSSPSPSLWGSTQDCTDGKNRKTYKIKSTYRAIAAIPTNTLLLEQQAIDDEVSKNEALLRPDSCSAWEDPHSEMCSPAQLRQQSAELYATIDEVLEDPIQRHVNKATAKSSAAEAPRANPHFETSVPEKTLTKPGVIKPVTLTVRLTDSKDDEEFHPNPFKSYFGYTSPRYHYKFITSTLFGEPRTDGRYTLDQQSDGREGLPSKGREDSKTSLSTLITQSKCHGSAPSSLAFLDLESESSQNLLFHVESGVLALLAFHSPVSCLCSRPFVSSLVIIISSCPAPVPFLISSPLYSPHVSLSCAGSLRTVSCG